MKKLVVLLIFTLSAAGIHGQRPCLYDKFFARDGVSVDLVTSGSLFKKSYSDCYHFNANGKNYMLSYEGGQKISTYLYDSDRVERKIYLYRQDDSISNVWNIASDVINVDYHKRIADPDKVIDFYDVCFIYTDDKIGSYVKPLKNGNIEICILKFRYESLKQENFETYYVKYLLKPDKDQTYKVKKI